MLRSNIDVTVACTNDLGATGRNLQKLLPDLVGELEYWPSSTGGHVETRNIDKHLGDELDHAVPLVPGQVVTLPGRMAQTLSDFVAVAAEAQLRRMKQG